MTIKYYIKYAACVIISPIFFFSGIVIAGFVRLFRRSEDRPHLVWGSTPLINNKYWSDSMRSEGYCSETFTNSFYSSINKREDWDRVLDDEWTWCPKFLKPLLAFLQSLYLYDIFFISADGFFIGMLPGIWRLQAPLLRLAGKKVIFIPYGSDAYVYKRILSTSLIHGFMMSYPQLSRKQDEIQNRLDYWCRHADVCVSGMMGFNGFGRWDVLVFSPLCIDLTQWRVSKRKSDADGKQGVVTICHAPNHQGVKGSEFIFDAVRKLQEEGLKVELLLLEKIQNSEVRRVLEEDVDILVEQLILGYGLNALEGMASALPVVSNLEPEEYLLPVRRWSYFSECPVVSANPESLLDVLRKLVTRPELRSELGGAGRQYVEKYHGYDSAVYLFESVINYANGRTPSLINMYHPLLGQYPRRLPLVKHPLVDNRIVD
jgi:hypothetical protein